MSRLSRPLFSRKRGLEAPLSKNWPAIVTSLSVTSLVCMMSLFYQGHDRKLAKSDTAATIEPSLMLDAVPELDDLAQQYNLQVSAITDAKECFPLHMSEKEKVGILYLYCSEQAYAEDGKGKKLTENFTVSDRMARRFNFWRRVYSLWTKDNYVLHVSKWPEVVIEAYNGSRLGDHVGPVGREVVIKRVAKGQRAAYKEMLKTMHKYRNSPERFTPAMKRVAAQMAHISQDDKYLVASYSLRLQRGQRDFIATGLATSGRYLHAIEEEFHEIGIPVELSRIAFVESSFNLKAKSKVGASGVYQIMPATGRQYLKLHSGVDERNDPIKASRAAAKLFALNYRLLGNWPLAVTAYNHGVGGVRKAVRRAGSDQLEDLIDTYTSSTFQFASKNFFASYLAVMATIQDARHVFPEIPKEDPMMYEEHHLASSTSLHTIRKRFGVTNAEIEDYNPDISKSVIRSSGTLPRGYRIKIPAKTVEASNASIVPPRS